MALMNQYYDHRWGRNVLSIGIGEMYVTDADLLIGTVLGSCISVVLWDPEKKIGGMNHYISPEPPYHDADEADSSRYGTNAIPQLVKKMTDAGADPAALQAKIFGGACVAFCSDEDEALPSSVGQRNTELALRLLNDMGIHPVQNVTGGSHGRRIYLDPLDFTVYLRKNS